MKSSKPFSGDQNLVTARCPKCDRTRTIDISKYSDKSSAIKGRLTCKCGQRYNFVIDRRKYHRKNLNIQGLIVVTTDLERFRIYGTPEGSGQDPAIVKDISITGLKIQFKVRPDIQVNDSVLIKFYLDDNQRDLIRKEVVVRNIEGDTLGVEFKDHHLDDEMNRIIGRFVLNQYTHATQIRSVK